MFWGYFIVNLVLLEVETAEQGPSVSKGEFRNCAIRKYHYTDKVLDKELKEAIMDLRKLGLSYSDILFQAKVDPLFLSNVFGSMDFPVPKPPPRTTAATSTATASATTNTTITTTTTNSAEKRSASSSSSGGGASSNIPPKEPAQNTVEPPSRPKSVPGLSQSQVPSRAPSRFGSDRWSQKLNIEVSDDEESDNESAAGSRQSSVNGCRSAKPNAPLKEKLRLEKEISELMRKMEAQKGVKNQQRKAAGTSPSVTPPIADSQPSSSGMSTPADSSRVSSTPVAPAQELRNKWAQALKRREEVRKRVSEYESKLNEFNVSNIEKEVDQLKRLLEEKMKAVMEAAYQSASVRAQHEAAERENAAAENEVKELEQQMLEIERQQQQEQQQGQKKEEEMHQKEVEITLQKKETVDENLHEECAAEEMELDDQPLQPAEDVTMNDNGGSDVQDASAAATDANMTQQKPENLPPLSTTDAGEQGTAQEDMAKSNNDVSTATETVKVSATVQHNEHNTRPEAVKMDVRGPSETTKESETVHVSTTIGNTEQNVQSESKETGHRDLPEKKKESETFQSSATVQSTEQNSQSEPMQVDRPDDSETGGESRPIEIDSSQPEDEEMSEAPETIPDTKIKGEDTTQGSVNMSSDKHIEVVDLLSDSEDEAAQPLPANETHHQEKAPTAVQPQAQDTTSAIQPQIQETTTTFQHQSQENASSVNPQFEDAHSSEPPSKDGAHVAENENQQPNEAEKKCSTVEDELDHPVKRKFYDMELVSSNRPEERASTHANPSRIFRSNSSNISPPSADSGHSGSALST